MSITPNCNCAACIIDKVAGKIELKKPVAKVIIDYGDEIYELELDTCELSMGVGTRKDSYGFTTPGREFTTSFSGQGSREMKIRKKEPRLNSLSGFKGITSMTIDGVTFYPGKPNTNE